MMMSINDKKILFTFGCPNRGLTVTRLRHAAALAVDPTAKKYFFRLAVMLNEEVTDDGYRNFFYNLRLEAERVPQHKYMPDSQPVPVDMFSRDYHKRMKDHLSECRDRYRRRMK